MWARTRLYGEGVAALLLGRAEIAEVHGVSHARACYTLAASGSFDAVLLDASLPDATASIGTLRQVAPELPIVALGVPESEDAMLRCVEAGASAFATAGQGIDDLIDVLAALVRGEACCSPRMTAALLRQVTALASGRDRSEIDSLTAREFEIGRLVGAGLSNKEIASELHIELATVKNHVHHVLGKLGVERRSRVAPRLLELELSEPASTRRTSEI
jgi:DNA-binding NarL/FixJ family response regulator